VSETEIQNQIRLTLSIGPTRLFRNNVGVLQDRHGNFVTYGLVPGSGDLIGLMAYEIRPEDVGRKVAVFVSMEVKKPRGSHTAQNQKDWRAMVRRFGGIAAVVKSVEAARDLLQSWRPGFESWGDSHRAAKRGG
jgi:hypothetical protein